VRSPSDRRTPASSASAKRLSVNSLSAIGNVSSAPSRPELRTLLTLLAPFAPFVTEELWSRIGEPRTIHQSTWAEVDDAALASASVTLVVQVDGRVRDRLTVAADLPDAEIETRALACDNVKRQLSGKQVARIVHVSANATRLVNIVTASSDA
jgi:leucyl-tRNA synthetase